MIYRLSSSVWVVWIVVRSSLTVIEVFGRHLEYCQQGTVPGLRVRARSQELPELCWRGRRFEEDQDILAVIFSSSEKFVSCQLVRNLGIDRYYLVDGPPFEIHGAGEVFCRVWSARVVRAKISCSSMALSLSRFLKHPCVHLQQHRRQQPHYQALFSRHPFLGITQTNTTPQILVLCDKPSPPARCLDRSFY